MHAFPAGRVEGPAPFYLTLVLLALVFVTGGGSYDRGWGDMAAELLALPLLVIVLRRLPSVPRTPVVVASAIGISAVVGLLVMYQLPLPQAFSNLAPGRDLLADDVLAAAGTPAFRWSLTPLASERGACSLLPALALFGGGLIATARQRLYLVWAVVGLVTMSLLLGLLQIGAPQDSLLNPFPEWPTSFAGVFASANHQGAALAIGALLALGLAFDNPWAQQKHAGSSTIVVRGLLMAVAAAMLVSLPLTGSRAAIVLALAAIGALMLVQLWRQRARLGRHLTLGLVIAQAVALAVVALIAWRWFQVDRLEELRTSITLATIEAGRPLAPFGGGLGSFVPWFQQQMPPEFVTNYYFNHAHNEYAQWWLEGGYAAALIILAVLAAVVLGLRSVVCVSTGPAGTRNGTMIRWAALLSVLVTLGHSLADYPLRTQAIMAIVAVLWSVVAARAQSAEPSV